MKSDIEYLLEVVKEEIVANKTQFLTNTSFATLIALALVKRNNDEIDEIQSNINQMKSEL